MTDTKALIAEAREIINECAGSMGGSVCPSCKVMDRLAAALEEATRQPTTKTATDAPDPIWFGPA